MSLEFFLIMISLYIYIMIKTTKTWFTGCSHFGHANIIKFCDRPFSNVEEMDRILIANWNNNIAKDDTVYHLGDFSWYNSSKTYNVLDPLNGKIHLIGGNHDQVITKNLHLIKKFESVSDYKEIYVEGFKQSVVLFHYPIESWNKQFHGSIHLHSHTHGNFFREDGLILDVGLDGVLCKSNDPKTYRPLEINEILDYMKTRKQITKKE